MRKWWKQNRYPVFLFFLSIIGYIWALWYAPTYDFADGFFQGRYFMFEAIRNNIFPVWQPYLSLGIPVHADPQTSTFYLPLWILSLFTDYQPVMWGVEHILHAFLGGLGFYFLTRKLIKNPLSSFIIAACFMLSGFYVANMQHISWIIAATWIPWLIKSFYAFFENPSLKSAFSVSLFASLLFTGGYTGFVFLVFLFFIILLFYYVILKLVKKEYDYFKYCLPYLFVILIFTVLLTLPALYSLYEVKDFITRGDALNYEQTTSVVFTPQSLLSLLFPYISCTEGEFMGTDISMGNIYIGAITLFFCIVGLFQKKPSSLKVFLYWGLACFFLSLGHYLPFHKWAFYTIPFMKMLRITAIFRLFVVMSLLLLALVGLNKVIGDFSSYRKPMRIYSASLAGLMLFLVVFFSVQKPEIVTSLFSLDLHAMMNASLYHKFVMEALFLCVLLILVLIILCNKRNYVVLVAIGGLMLTDVVFNAWICERKVGMTQACTNKQFKELLDRQPKAFPVPKQITSSSRIYQEEDFGTFWRNLGVFTKQIEWDSYNPFVLKPHAALTKPFYHAGIELCLNTVAFFPKAVMYVSEPVIFSSDTSYTFEEERIYVSMTKEELPEVEVELFHPGSIILNTHSAEQRPLVVCQSFYPGWRAKTEQGDHLEIYPLNSSLLSISVPEGEQRIHLYYSRGILKYGFLLQGVVFMLLLLYFFLSFVKKLKKTSEFTSLI